MQLYFKPGACSLSSRIILTELGIAHEAIKVDTDAGLTETGVDYRTINPRGYVPALALEPGVVITENPAILQYLADQYPKMGLAPEHGTVERANLQQWLNFTSSELHKAFGPYFGGQPLEDSRRTTPEALLSRRIGDVEQALSDGRRFILGDRFTVADAYLFVVLNWTEFVGLDLTAWPHVKAFLSRVAARPSVRSAMLAEGLIEGAPE